jgi:hypothetical protein
MCYHLHIPQNDNFKIIIKVTFHTKSTKLTTCMSNMRRTYVCLIYYFDIVRVQICSHIYKIVLPNCCLLCNATISHQSRSLCEQVIRECLILPALISVAMQTVVTLRTVSQLYKHDTCSLQHLSTNCFSNWKKKLIYNFENINFDVEISMSGNSQGHRTKVKYHYPRS